MTSLVADGTVTAPVLRECPSCGSWQVVPALTPGSTAVCGRCDTLLRRVFADPFGRSLALNLAGLVLLCVICATTLMTVDKAGIGHAADIFSGPQELARRGMVPLALVVVFTTVLAPFGKLLGTIYVLLGLRRAKPALHLRRVFIWVERLRPWSMIEVFVFGVFVAYVKLGGLVTIGLGPGVFALLALTIILIWADSALDGQAVWESLAQADSSWDRRSFTTLGHARMVGCEVCGMACAWRPGTITCARCHSPVHDRRPQSLARTWALVIAAAVLYVPANLYPVLTVVQLGAGSPSTIMGGVRELIESRMYPLAALVFTASIAVPMLKLIGLVVMLIATQTGRSGWLRERTRLYHFVRFIGRWSMIDIFMESLLGALVRFGNVVTIAPGAGAVAFCAVVILTMLAAESFDPRLMWDAGRRVHALPDARQVALGDAI